MALAMTPVRNYILATLPDQDRARYFSTMETAVWPPREVVYEVGDVIDYIYFPEEGVASVLTIMADSSMSEVGMIGIEGVVGLNALLGGHVCAQHIVVQVPGRAWRMPTSAVKEAFEQSISVRASILRFAESFINLAAQTAACNRLHTIQQRCARWMLMARDRSSTDEMPMTHDFLSSMLGVRRSGVTVIANELAKQGLISYTRGRLRTLN